MELTRRGWIELAEYSLKQIRHSNHNLKLKRSIDEFLGELKAVMNKTLGELST